MRTGKEDSTVLSCPDIPSCPYACVHPNLLPYMAVFVKRVFIMTAGVHGCHALHTCLYA